MTWKKAASAPFLPEFTHIPYPSHEAKSGPPGPSGGSFLAVTTTRAWTARFLACAAIASVASATACGGSNGYVAYILRTDGGDDAGLPSTGDDGSAPMGNCGPCSGCCDSNGNCQAGNSDTACGPSGGICTDCQNTGQMCDPSVFACTGGTSSSSGAGGGSSSGGSAGGSSGGNPFAGLLMGLMNLFGGGGGADAGHD